MKTLQVITLLALAALLALHAFSWLSPGDATTPPTARELREQAALLRANQLHAQAAELYEHCLRTHALPPDEAAGLHFLLGMLYEEDLHDHERALGHYLVVRELYGDTEPAGKVGRRIVACLEQTDRSREAQRTLAGLTDLIPEQVESATSGVVVARIGERDITMGHVDAFMETLPARHRATIGQNREQMRELVRELVLRELLYDRALRQGLDTTPRVRRQVAQFERSMLADQVREAELARRVALSPNDVDLHYRANREQYTRPASVHAAHILLAATEDAAEVLRRLGDGETFADLARELSQDSATRDTGGALGLVREGELPPGLGHAPQAAAALLALEVGAVTGPIEVSDGYSLLTVTERTPTHLPPLEDIRARVEQDARREREQRAMQALVDELLRVENAVIFEERIGG